MWHTHGVRLVCDVGAPQGHGVYPVAGNILQPADVCGPASHYQRRIFDAQLRSCGPTEVMFQNNVPSNGKAGFSYLWDFGNGQTFTGENPPPMLYANPGVYPVNYKAVIDTSPYILQSVIVKTVGCTDPPLFGGPDLYVRILDPSGAIIYNSSPSINNTPLPYAFNPMLALGAGNYSLEVWDEDGGIKGTDDPCGSVPFNILSNGDLNAGSLSVTLLIEKPITEVLSSDTVVVYAQPAPPMVNSPSGYAVCANSNQSVVLTSSYGFGNQWLLNGALLPGANDFVVIAPQSGYYQAQVVTPEAVLPPPTACGCLTLRLPRRRRLSTRITCSASRTPFRSQTHTAFNGSTTTSPSPARRTLRIARRRPALTR